MAVPKSLCHLYLPGYRVSALPANGYLATEHINQLPKSLERDGHVITGGYATELASAWFFFPALEPAIVFGGQGGCRPSAAATGCSPPPCRSSSRPTHLDERVLHYSGDNLDRRPDELSHLQRFVQAVKEHPWSAYWHEPTGFISDRHGPTPTRSLPL